MKCIVCGEKEASINGMCSTCFLKSKRFVNPPKKIEISVCPRCGAIKTGNSWHYDINKEEGINRLIKKETSLKDDRVGLNFTWEIIENQNLLNVKYYVSHGNEMKLEQDQVPVIIKIQTCPRCSKFTGDYFESILQIRSDRKLSENDLVNIKKFVLDTIANEMKKNPELYILKEEIKDGGFDLYLSSNSSTRSISKKIAENYGATVKESPHLAGVKNGEKFFRVTFSVRLPKYDVGDFIKSGNERLKILAIRKGQIKVTNIENGSIGSITQKDINDRNFQIFAKKENVESAVVIFEKDNEVEIMDLNSYKTITVKKPPFKISKEVYIVHDGDLTFIIGNKI